MPRGRVVPQSVKDKVNALVWNNRDISGKKVKELVEAEQKVSFTKRTYEKLISLTRLKAKEIEASPLERAWCFGVLSNKDTPSDILNMSAEAIAKVFEVQKWVNKTWNTFGLHFQVTVRQARWVARLYKLINDDSSLFIFSWAYCMFEIVSSLSGNFNDTYELDKQILDNKIDYDAIVKIMNSDVMKNYMNEAEKRYPWPEMEKAIEKDVQNAINKELKKEARKRAVNNGND